MKKIFSIVAILWSTASMASGNIEIISVEDQKVRFSIDGDLSSQLPTCVSTGNENHYALSLENETGRAMYPLLLTGIATPSLNVSVTGAEDCAVIDGVQRANKVELVASQSHASPDNLDKPLVVYKSDGVTPVGKFASIESNRYVSYVDDSGMVKILDTRVANYELYFESADCSGVPHADRYVSSIKYMSNKNFENGKLMTYVGSGNKRLLSKLSSQIDSACESINEYIRAYSYELKEHEICGNKMCILK